MKNDKRIKTYNNRFIRELDRAILTVEPTLIDVFTSFYGEEYRSKIKNIIKNVNYVYFLSFSFLEALNREGMLNHKDRKIVEYYLTYLRKLKGKNEVYFAKKILVSPHYDESFLENEQLLAIIKSGTPTFTLFTDEDETKIYRTIFLPIYTINLKIIIHEINHAFMVDAICETEEELVIPSLFMNIECEELINDYMAEQILGEYKRKKGIIPDCLKRFTFHTFYEDKYYLIESFYYVFERVIKISIMTGSFNLLWEYAGKNNFESFCSLIKEYQAKECSNKELLMLEKLVLNMMEDASLIKGIDIETYFSELERQGHFVRRLKKE